MHRELATKRCAAPVALAAPINAPDETKLNANSTAAALPARAAHGAPDRRRRQLLPRQPFAPRRDSAVLLLQAHSSRGAKARRFEMIHGHSTQRPVTGSARLQFRASERIGNRAACISY